MRPTPSAPCARTTSWRSSRRWRTCATAVARSTTSTISAPPCALGRRIDGEPISHWPPAHGARDQGAHVVGRDRHDHAAGSHQLQARGGRGARVLWLVAIVAVHGSDQSALGDHPQAPALGAWAGWSYPRAGWL